MKRRDGVRIVAKLPLPEGSYLIDQARHENHWILMYHIPEFGPRCFIFDLETEKFMEVH